MHLLQHPLTIALLVSLSSALSPNSLSILRRQTQTCGSDISSQCTISLQACVNAICSTCQSVPGIAQCCALTTDDLISECITNSEEGATQSSIPTAAAATTTVNSAVLSSELASPDATACADLGVVFDACSDTIPYFTAQPFSQKASCLCYVSSTWVPNFYDGLFSSCLGFYSTVSSAYYSSIVEVSDFVGFAPCSTVGDVVSSSPASVSASTTSSLSTSASFVTSSSSSQSFSFVGGTENPTSNQAAPSTAASSASPTETATSGAGGIHDHNQLLYGLPLAFFASLLVI